MRMSCVALVMIALLVAPAAGQASDPFLITPGVGIGPLTVGENIQNAITALGEPQTVLPDKNAPTGSPGTIYSWYPYTEVGAHISSDTGGGLAAAIQPNGTIRAVIVYYEPRYHTVQGLHTGAHSSAPNGPTRTNVEKILGAPASVVHHPGGQGLVYDGLIVWVYAGHVFEFEVLAHTVGKTP